MEIFKNKTIILIWNLLKKWFFTKLQIFLFSYFKFLPLQTEGGDLSLTKTLQNLLFWNMKSDNSKGEKLHWFLYSKNMANYEKFPSLTQTTQVFLKKSGVFIGLWSPKNRAFFLAISTANYKMFSGFLVWTGQPI